MNQRGLFDCKPPQEPTSEEPPGPLTVSELTQQIQFLLESEFYEVWVQGEISNFRRSQAGHCYFTLKDAGAQLGAVLWRNTAQSLSFQPEDGLEVVCRGSLDVYPPRGTYQLIVEEMHPRGLGALELAFRQLFQRLKSQGLFDPRHKKPLPRFPRRVALITSPTGAAVQDVLTSLSRRWPALEVLIVPVAVQGEEAPGQIVQALRVVNRLVPPPDVAILARGGGSLEDLWAFNTEEVVRAIFDSQVPVVSAVGHEIDTTLADLVADVRALTPTDAGGRVVPDRREVLAHLNHLAQRLRRHLLARIQWAQARLDQWLRHPLLRRPEELLYEPRQHLDETAAQLERSMQRLLEDHRTQLAQLAARLEALSPLGVLSRGYSLTLRKQDGTVITHHDQVKPGELILTQLAKGTLTSRVESTQQEGLWDRLPSSPKSDS